MRKANVSQKRVVEIRSKRNATEYMMKNQMTFQKSNQMRNLAHECRANHMPNVTL